jgi:hypothetical protein
MTKNNLRQHLSWLLSRGPSIPTSITLTRTASEFPNSVNQNNILTFIVNRSPDELNIPENNDDDDAPALGNQVDNDGDVVFTNTDMAKLQFNPLSGTKPRMLSCIKSSVSSTPNTPSTRGFKENGTRNDAAEGLIYLISKKGRMFRTHYYYI